MRVSKVDAAEILTMLSIVLMLSLIVIQPWSQQQDEAAPEPVETDVDALFSQGVALLRSEHYELAIDRFRSVLAEKPSMPEVYSNIGFAQFGLGRYELALQAFDTATVLRPTQANAYWGMAVSSEARCDLDAAIGAMRTYLHLGGAEGEYASRARAALWEWQQQRNRSAAEEDKTTGCQRS